jgi:hypothetical protein
VHEIAGGTGKGSRSGSGSDSEDKEDMFDKKTKRSSFVSVRTDTDFKNKIKESNITKFTRQIKKRNRTKETSGKKL